ncbi:MAG: DUF1501 domain-containing protein [Planctomycetota bacterium]|nr:DUF1501 domain-containing protein [Planctomycetota bacterium]MEC9009870.1 DUF1501 domain-containing protein [Planctomycetota bacterium]
MKHRVSHCPGPFSRRQFLSMGTLGVSGVGLADVMRMKAEAGITTDPDTSFLFVWLPGGPPHMEMYDMKPNAPADYRGIFNPIPTTVPGLDVCELMPRHARMAHKYNVVRSISHTFADHGGGHKRLQTGRKPATPTGTVNDAPSTGSIVSKTRENYEVGLPNYISCTPNGRQGTDVFAFGSAYLGPSYVPFAVPGDPGGAKFEVKNLGLSRALEDRLDDRVSLLKGLDTLQSNIDRKGALDSLDKFNTEALSLLTSNKARKAFDLSEEPDHVRDLYGRHCWGNRCLLGRRLIEAGCSFVTVVLENPYKSGIPSLKAGTYNWDSHAVNCHIFEDAKVRLPIYDHAISGLVEDLHQRGLADRKVLLVVTGEFGRTPRLTVRPGTQTKVDQPGRDHWPQAMSLVTTGSGMTNGQVVGSTNSRGEHPHDRPLEPGDLWATVYRHLGIDPEWTFPDHSGRPMPILPSGHPIRELT